MSAPMARGDRTANRDDAACCPTARRCASTPTMPTDDLRTRYEAAVAALRDAAAAKRHEGMSDEAVARWVVAERNALKAAYRDLTPAPMLARIVARTVQRYGSLSGPTVEELRASGKSWADIIESATRPGKHPNSFFSGD
jgi:hypothetical protein